LGINRIRLNWFGPKELRVEQAVILNQHIGVPDIGGAMVEAVRMVECLGIKATFRDFSQDISWVLEQVPQFGG
jgi:hypothetical protein